MQIYPQTMLGTCCVPWKNGELDEEIFRSSIRYSLGQGLRDLYIFGTAGEGYAVSERQFDEVTRVFVEEMSTQNAPPMVGIISLSLATVIERIERAIEMGARRFQISLPSWGALSTDEMHAFFREVCARFPECEFLHYNLMRSRRLVTPSEYSRLAQQHPNLVATKQGTSDLALIDGLMTKAPQIRHFFTEFGFAHATLIGDCGLLVSIGASNLRRAREYFEAGMRRDLTTLTAMQLELLEMRAALQVAMGTGTYMDGAYDKIYCKLQDERFPLDLLPPYAGAGEAAFRNYCDALRTCFPRWLPQ